MASSWPTLMEKVRVLCKRIRRDSDSGAMKTTPRANAWATGGGMRQLDELSTRDRDSWCTSLRDSCGVCCYACDGIKQDVKKAVDLFEIAHRAGVPQATPC